MAGLFGNQNGQILVFIALVVIVILALILLRSSQSSTTENPITTPSAENVYLYSPLEIQPQPFLCDACPSELSLATDQLENGNGNAIAINPGDGLIYHASGITDFSDFWIRSFDPDTGVITTVRAPSNAPGNAPNVVTAWIFDPLRNFWLVCIEGDLSGGQLWSFSPDFSTGTLLFLSTNSYNSLFFVDGQLYGIADGSYRVTLIDLDLETETEQLLTYKGEGDLVGFLFSGALNPLDGKVYISLTIDDNVVTGGIGILDLETFDVTPTCLTDPSEGGTYRNMVFTGDGAMFLQSRVKPDAFLYSTPAAPCPSTDLPNLLIT